MGTTLTGTTPQDTYDSLIKVTDNGPLSGTLKKLTDGLGNDSSLSLSTTAASLSGTLAVASDVKLGTATTGTPSANADDLVIDKGAAESGITIMSTAAATLRFGDAANTSIGSIEYDHSGDYMRFNTSGSEKVRITSAGNVGIGTTAPPSKLSVFANNDTYGLQINTNVASAATTRLSIGSFGAAGAAGANGSIAVGAVHNHSGSAQSALTFYTHDGSNLNEVGRFLATGGLTFNGDTAAANALDDYEEGTWTMGVSFGGLSVGVTYGNNTGKYTKIGRQVTVSGYMNLTSKGSSTGAASITGLPFAIPNLLQNYAAATLWFNNVTFANQFQAIGTVNDTRISLEEVTEAGAVSGLSNADFANNSEIIVNFTYFV